MTFREYLLKRSIHLILLFFLLFFLMWLLLLLLLTACLLCSDHNIDSGNCSSSSSSGFSTSQCIRLDNICAGANAPFNATNFLRTNNSNDILYLFENKFINNIDFLFQIYSTGQPY